MRLSACVCTCSTPSTRTRTCRPSSCGSMCTSEAPTWVASSNSDCSRRTTGAPSRPTEALSSPKSTASPKSFSSARAKPLISSVRRYRRSNAGTNPLSGTAAMEILRLRMRLSSSNANRSSGSPRAINSVSPLSSSTSALKRRAADSGSNLTTSGRNGKVLRLTNGIRSCRAKPLASNSSVMMPVSISRRPIFLPVVRCNSSVCCNCS